MTQQASRREKQEQHLQSRCAPLGKCRRAATGEARTYVLERLPGLEYKKDV
jgi:hypothetical protein